VSCLARRKVSAWAFPGFGDRFGKVGEQHRCPQPHGDRPDEEAGLTRKATEVTRLPTSTTNMTGLRPCGGIELHERLDEGTPQDSGSSIEVPARRRTLGGRVSGGGATATAPPESSGSSITTGTVARCGSEPSVCRSAVHASM